MSLEKKMKDLEQEIQLVMDKLDGIEERLDEGYDPYNVAAIDVMVDLPQPDGIDGGHEAPLLSGEYLSDGLHHSQGFYSLG
ncbi:unnamed protein product, partial [marine sediment metagenome]